MKIQKHAMRLRAKHSGAINWVVALFWAITLFLPGAAGQAEAGDIGYRDFTYPSGTGGNTDATGEKPESKLWWNDGAWYGVMWSTTGEAFHIYQLDTSAQVWYDTGVAVDDRLKTKADVLWDGTHLYVVSHIFSTSTGPAAAGQRGELFRYSYNTSTKTYSLDSGFPVEVNSAITESLVIDKDSSGTLWVTYVENKTVMVNHSLNGDDRAWGTPYALPADGMEKVTSDDLSSIITYNQHIGIMWSNQNSPKTMYFAVHPVGASDNAWTRARAYSISGDDHINLKTLQSDNAGNVFAVVKTSKNSALIMVLVCKSNGNRCKNDTDWASYTVYDSATYDPTRPIMLIDESNRHLYVFTRNEDDDGSNKGGIYYKRANLDNISFPSGMGTPFIRTALDYRANDPTSTKQNVNSATGLVVMASDTATHYYLHNYLPLDGSPPPAPAIDHFSPTSGPPGTEVTINGSNFNGLLSVKFNGQNAASYNPVSSTQVTAVVPSGASSGPIMVTTSAGSAASPSTFTVSAPPPTATVISSFAPASGPVGTEVTLTGSNLGEVTSVTFNGLSAASFIVVSNTEVRAVVPAGAASGLISVASPAGSASSATSFEVSQGGEDPVKYYLTIILQGGGNVTSSPFLMDTPLEPASP